MAILVGALLSSTGFSMRGRTLVIGFPAVLASMALAGHPAAAPSYPPNFAIDDDVPGIAVDPNYYANHFIYLAYVVDPAGFVRLTGDGAHYEYVDAGGGCAWARGRCSGGSRSFVGPSAYVGSAYSSCPCPRSEPHRV